jgi:hypothetical protein
LTLPRLSQNLRSVLREIKSVKQERGTGRRRWFESDGLDLVVWLDASGNVTGFQLCYDFGQGEQALTWREGTGFAHSNVDAGDETPLKNRTPDSRATGGRRSLVPLGEGVRCAERIARAGAAAAGAPQPCRAGGGKCATVDAAALSGSYRSAHVSVVARSSQLERTGVGAEKRTGLNAPIPAVPPFSPTRANTIVSRIK